MIVEHYEKQAKRAAKPKEIKGLKASYVDSSTP
jgi:hypothetical protein